MKRFNLSVIILFSLLISAATIFAYPGQIIKNFKLPYNFSTGLTFDGKYLWVADYKADKLVCMNPENGKVVREIASPGFWPMGLAWDGKALWNVDKMQKKIFKVDPADGTILAAIDAPGSDPEGLTWDGETLWLTDPRADEIMKLDLSDGTAVRSFPSPSTYPQGLTYDGIYLWCSDRIKDEIHMIDPNNGEVIMILDAPGPYSRGLAWDGKNLWNVDYEMDRLYRLVHNDDDIYRLKNTRNARITLTHQVTGYGHGQIKNLDVYFAIPQDMKQQKIKTKKFTPSDFDVVRDRWDQPFAHFNYQSIPAETRTESQMVVEAEISEINYFIFPDRCGTLEDIPSDIKEVFTANGSKYETDNPFIQKTVKEVVGDEQNPYWVARKIFDYVRNTLDYKLEGGWNVAPVVLQRGTGSCSEYTFSFVSLCRAAGVPARYVGSIVVRGDDASMDDVYHRWPEIYLPSYGWIPMDPEGGDRSRPRDRAMYIGHLSNRFLITTQGGGDSKYMGWYYNTYETYTTDPQVKVNIESFGEWEPLEAED